MPPMGSAARCSPWMTSPGSPISSLGRSSCAKPCEAAPPRRREMRLRAAILSVLAAAVLTLATQAQEAKPRVPPGRAPGGVAIALISTGIDYTIPEIAQRLARDGEGELVGWGPGGQGRRTLDTAKEGHT